MALTVNTVTAIVVTFNWKKAFFIGLFGLGID
jgi:hypothetical protein